MLIDDAQSQANFATALRASECQAPDGLVLASAHRFAVYRNTIAVRLLETLEANFPAVRSAVGQEFFAAMARAFAAEHPPRQPILTFYGDELPGFLERFPPVAEIAYLPDLARIEVNRTRAAYAADVEPLPGETLGALSPESLSRLVVGLHPAVAIVSSLHPIATIWAMNAGRLPIAPICDWHAQSVVIARPQREVVVHRLPPGGDAFLAALAEAQNLAKAAAAAMAADGDFDLGCNLACLFNHGLAARISFEPDEGQ